MTNAESDAIIEALKAELKESRYHTDKLQARLHSVTAPLTRDTYSEAVRIYGKHSQLIMSMEEMAELSKELSKNIRVSITLRLWPKKWPMWKSCWNN